MKSELLDAEARGEDDYNSIDDMTREESSQEENQSFFDNAESDENDEENSETKKRKSMILDQMSNNPLIKGDFGTSFISLNFNLIIL